MTIKQLRTALNDAESLTIELENMLDSDSNVVLRDREEIIDEAIATINRLLMIIEKFEIQI